MGFCGTYSVAHHQQQGSTQNVNLWHEFENNTCESLSSSMSILIIFLNSKHVPKRVICCKNTDPHQLVQISTMRISNWYKRCTFIHCMVVSSPLTEILSDQGQNNFLYFLIFQFFQHCQTTVIYWILCWYFTGVKAAYLQWHLPNMNMIQII